MLWNGNECGKKLR